VSPGGVDRVSLVAGIAFALLGGLLGLDQLDLIALAPGLVGAGFCAAAGAALVAAGLGPEHDDA
jgi:hypothetical protein